MTTPRHVFVGGVHRSGTSWVHRLLRGHPDVSGMTGTGVWEDEGQHLQDVYPTARVLGGPGRFGLHPEAPLTEDSALCSPESAERLRRAWGRWWDDHSPVRVEKSPPNIVRFRFLQALFPGARCVAVVRHPLAVAYSTRRMRRRYRVRSLSSLIENWLACQDRFEADRGSLDAVHVVRYEDLVADPQTEYARLTSFCGLSAAPLPEDHRKGNEARWREAWRARLALPGGGRRILRLEDRVRTHGYSLRAFDGHHD